MSNKLTEAQIADCKAAFVVFDKGSGKIASKELGSLIRALGHNPTEAEIKHMLTQLSDDAHGLIDFPQFLSFMAQRMPNNDSAEDIIDAFRAFDREGKGYITVADLRHVMTNLGEQMSEEEADELLKYADINSDGLIDYKAFVTKMLK